MTSWDVLDVMSSASNNVFPLQLTQLLLGSIDTRSISGSGNYFRLTRPESSPETVFRMTAPGGGIVSFAGARVYVVRLAIRDQGLLIRD
jgi:hypothetical protein